jgi:hypothetical protein
MADFYNKVEFSSISPFMKMGISLFQEELQQTGGNNNNNNIDGLSNLYFPGGLFVTDYMKNLREEEKTEEEKDPSKIEVTENFDVFIDLVSNNNNNNSSIKSNNNSSIKSNKKTKTKRSSIKKLKNN